jgi:hypothetical protein
MCGNKNKGLISQKEPRMACGCKTKKSAHKKKGAKKKTATKKRK